MFSHGEKGSRRGMSSFFSKAGIAPSTVHFLTGAGGAAFLGRLGNWFTRTLSEGLTEARESLESGATMVGVFQVADPDSKAIGKTLSDAGVESLHYFGSWTYT